MAVVVPEEIIMEEILIGLPMKSLVRCRCVCKSWNAQFYNPNFLIHLNHRSRSFFSLNPPERDDDDDDYLILMNYCYNRKTTTPYTGLSILCRKNLSETCIMDDDNYVPPYPLSLDVYDIELVGCINGLVCIAFYFEKNYQFVLWNPMIRCSKKISMVRIDDTNRRYRLLCGFGWDSVTNDYKLIAKPVNRGVLSAAGYVYSCKTDRWSNISSLSLIDSCTFIGRHPSVIVNGSPYWYNWNWNWKDSSILKFDVQNNEFTYLIKAPSHDSHDYTNLINLNDSLAFIKYIRYHVGAAQVYRYDEHQNNWMHMYTIHKYMNHNYNHIKVHCFKYGGEIVFHGKKHLYLCDPMSREIKSRRRCCPKCRGCLLVKSRKRKHHGSHDCEGYSVGNGFSYTPSLVALPGMKAALHM